MIKNLQQDFDSLIAPSSALTNINLTNMNRRDFLQVALGTSFAAAVLPVAAQNVIYTDAAGLIADTVSIKSYDRDIPVYRAQPQGRTNLPVILVISEIFGVHAHIADVARRFAKQGYLALAPALFVRQGDPAAYPTIADLMKEIIAKTPDDQVMRDLDACVAWASQHDGNIDKLGVTGFCWGGRITWLYGSHNPQVKAGVAWYGRLVGDKTPLTPLHPIDIAPTLQTPTLGLYGGKDTGIPLDTVKEMKNVLAQNKRPSELLVYPNAGHAFNADYRPSYMEADAKDAWQRCLNWLQKYGVK